MTEETPSYDIETQSIADYAADLRLLAQFQKIEEFTMSELKALRLAFENSPEYQALIGRLKEAQEYSDKLASVIKANAVQEYLAKGEKHPHKAVGIRLETSLAYATPIAITWCEQNLPQAIKLDHQLFEKHARAVADTYPLEFVQISKQPKATIATDLSEYLPPEDNTPVEIDFDKIEPIPV